MTESLTPLNVRAYLSRPEVLAKYRRRVFEAVIKVLSEPIVWPPDSDFSKPAKDEPRRD